jgi:hypothetical protein
MEGDVDDENDVREDVAEIEHLVSHSFDQHCEYQHDEKCRSSRDAVYLLYLQQKLVEMQSVNQ